MNSLHDRIRKAPSFIAFLDDMAELGVMPVKYGGRSYAVIAARSNPRWWLLPLDNHEAAASGLELMQPITHAAKVAKFVASRIARFGPLSLLGKGRIRLSGFPDLGGSFGEQAAHVAYFTGTDGPHRKTSLQVMDSNGRILGYAKFSREAHVRPYISNEAQVLKQIASLHLKTVNVPQVLILREDEGLTLLVTDSLKSPEHAVRLVPGVEHLAFLKEICAQSQRIGGLKTLDQVARKSAELAPLAGKEWVARLAKVDAILRPIVDDIPVCLAHGDFTPWNSFLQGGRLYVFDWEYACQTWPVGFDLAHFYLSITPPKMQVASLQKLVRLLAETHFNRDKKRALWALLLCLACHAIFYLNRLREVNSPLDAWIEGPVRAELIDQLLKMKVENTL